MWSAWCCGRCGAFVVGVVVAVVFLWSQWCFCGPCGVFVAPVVVLWSLWCFCGRCGVLWSLLCLWPLWCFCGLSGVFVVAVVFEASVVVLSNGRWESLRVLDPRREGSYVWSRNGHDGVRCSVV